jgi:hypothetical protein
MAGWESAEALFAEAEAIQKVTAERFWIASLRSQMTGANPRSRDARRPSFARNFSRLQKIEGAGNAGCSMHPQLRVQ